MFLTTVWFVCKAASQITGSMLLESGFAEMGKTSDILEVCSGNLSGLEVGQEFVTGWLEVWVELLYGAKLQKASIVLLGKRKRDRL